jgi:inorganic phosphate transporter, PiT family
MVFIFLATLFLAYANGANDNFKGVATLYGSGTTNYKKSLIYATITTALGSLMALYLASDLIIVFKGEGLVPEEVIQMKNFPLAVGAGAALTVMSATIFNLPVSTTHALVGALTGAGWSSSELGVCWDILSKAYFLPLLAGPILSLVLALIIYSLFKKIRDRLNIDQETCFCVGEKIVVTAQESGITKEQFENNTQTSLVFPEAVVASQDYCYSSYLGKFAGISAGNVLNGLHYLSSGLVCFSRGLNDTPKIAALLLIGSRFDLNISIFAVSIAMVVGGLIHSKRIAITMGKKVTEMNRGQAFTANMVTGMLVLLASRFGVPVSTTHVACGSIFGIGISKRNIDLKVLSHIILAWVTTLPLGFMFGIILILTLNYN